MKNIAVTHRVGTFLVAVLGLVSFATWAEEVVTVGTEYGGKIGFMLLKPDKPQAAVVLFPGGPGDLRLSEKKHTIRSQENSFLVRNRKDFAERGFMVALVDAPSGVNDLRRAYRVSEKHGQDIRAVVRYLKGQADVPVWLVGHSRGTFSAANGAIRVKDLVSGLVLTSTATLSRPEYAIFKTHPNGVINMPLKEITVPTLVIANRHDTCYDTPAANAEKLAKAFTGATRTGVKIFEGKPDRQDNHCTFEGQHQFPGFEEKVVDAIAAFMK